MKQLREDIWRESLKFWIQNFKLLFKEMIFYDKFQILGLVLKFSRLKYQIYPYKVYNLKHKLQWIQIYISKPLGK